MTKKCVKYIGTGSGKYGTRKVRDGDQGIYEDNCMEDMQPSKLNDMPGIHGAIHFESKSAQSAWRVYSVDHIAFEEKVSKSKNDDQCR